MPPYTCISHFIAPHVGTKPTEQINCNSRTQFVLRSVDYCIIIIIIIIRLFCPRAGPSLQAQELRLQFCQRQVFHRKLRNQGCSFTMDWIGASFCWFPHLSLSLSSEQTLKNLKRSQGHQHGGEESGFGRTGPSGLHRNSPQELNISSIKVFDQIRDPKIPITLPTRLLYEIYMWRNIYFRFHQFSCWNKRGRVNKLQF